MSEQDDALREMAANRGCKLVKSRRRKPGGDFGRYGLKDARTGKALFGFGDKGLTATAEEIQSYLRGDTVAGWKRSMFTAVGSAASPAPARRRRSEPPPPPPPSRRKAARAAPERAGPTRRRERRNPEPEPPKPPKIREASPADAVAMARLLVELGYQVTAADVRKRLQQLRKAGEPALVADRDGLVGCLSWHVTPVLHRPRPVGRITMLVVAEAERGAGIGTLLVEAAEARLSDAGCGLVEVTSNVKRIRAHGFYRERGFERTSYRFAKSLPE